MMAAFAGYFLGKALERGDRLSDRRFEGVVREVAETVPGMSLHDARIWVSQNEEAAARLRTDLDALSVALELTRDQAKALYRKFYAAHPDDASQAIAELLKCSPGCSPDSQK